MSVFKALQRVAVVLLPVVVMLVVSAPRALAGLSAWWHLGAGARPSTLVAGSARDEVQEVTVSATGGSFELEEIEESGNPNETRIARFPYNATAAEVQQGIEKEVFRGGREVRVAEGVGDTNETHSWVVTFPDQTVKPMEAISGGLSGGQSQVSVRETSQGQPDGKILVTASNLGDASITPASALHIRDVLPGGLRAVAMQANAPNAENDLFFPQVFECSYKVLECAGAVRVAPYKVMEALVSVVVEPGARSGEVNEASVSGGGLPGASVRRPVPVGGELAGFGVESYEMTFEEAGGAADTQAGSHPFQLTSVLSLNQTAGATPVALAKDLSFRLPPGLVGNPVPLPQCSIADFLTKLEGGFENVCSPQTAIGVAVSYITVPIELHHTNLLQLAVPLFNLEPSVGEPARFGFKVHGTPVFLDTSVRTGEDYGVTVNIDNINEEIGFLSSEVTLWGVPGDPRHDSVRGWGCLEDTLAGHNFYPCSASEVHNPPPFLSLPTSCTGALQSSVEADSWVQEGVFSSLASEPLPAMDGCNRLPFSPSITVAPDGQQASTPTGLTVGVHIPQDSTLATDGLAESAVRDTTVTLPVGVQISPAAADGLFACGEQQVGFTGVQAQTLLFTPGVGECPDASKVGTVEIKTPLLPEPLEGSVYLAAQDANPFGSLIALYAEAQAPRAGVVVKLAGEVKLDERTGQIVTTFPNSPQVPFEEARLHFFGGNRAPLSTPALCGAYTSTESVTPWSGNTPAGASSTFQITSGPNGGQCANPRPFQPAFQAGTTSVQAGGYSPLTITMSRPDADQPLGKLSVVFPPGISAGLRGVKLCEEPQAATGACPAESQIGKVIASAGLGGDPYSVETGKAYITGPYEGAPFGVDVVVPAVAGPFNLGTEVVRSKVEVDPTDAHLTVVSDKFPTMLDGIPLQLQHINVTVNRPGFVFNPTDCNPMRLTGELESSEGAAASVETPFQVTNCAALSFKPEFKVSTDAKTSRTEGASLHVTLNLPNLPRGEAANVAKVKVSLPKALPSPLKTLQKACTEKVFAENPAHCPVASHVGDATVSTPVLEGPLSGPAYFVSHGGAKYPELIIVLTGEDGVTVQVHGETFISKQGITTATFSTVPDVPFSGFELTLPKREYPALSANGNLCQAQAAGKLVMPTEMVGQNGDKITQQTKISVTGCGKVKKKASHARHKGNGTRKKRGKKR